MNSFTLWEDDKFVVSTPNNPHFPYSEGQHIIVSPQHDIPNAWDDIELAGDTFRMASQVCKIMENLKLAPWFNIQANGNWGLLPNGTPKFHVHIYGRQKTESWGKPIVLPELPGTYQNDPMPESERKKLADELKQRLG
jgi:diadenosine tetraphosphate (Ap4A) HIT family hydrolase